MPIPVRRLALGLLFAGAAVGGGTASAPVAAQECDPSYLEICLAAYPDLDCIDMATPSRSCTTRPSVPMTRMAAMATMTVTAASKSDA